VSDDCLDLTDRPVEREDVVVVGKESVGKSELVASLTGDRPTSGNFRGTTVESEVYTGGGYRFIDTPGIMLDADAETTREAIGAVETTDIVLLVVQATSLDDDLADLLPLVQEKVGVVVVTFWDKVDDRVDARQALEELQAEMGVPVVPVDARDVTPLALTDPDQIVADGGIVDTSAPEDGAVRIVQAIERRGTFPGGVRTQTGWRIEPPETILEWDYVGPVVSGLLLLLPAVVVVQFANTVAAEVDPIVSEALEPAVQWAGTLPGPLSAVLGGNYGLISMGPFLFVWAGPTIVIFALFMGVYKTSGLVTRITAALHPSMRRVGLTGRDLVRVIMGFGCNVPAVINTRGCSDCTRCTTISAISFGSACSYQFPATLAVFAAVELPELVVPYLLVLTVTTLIYVRLIAPEEARHSTMVVDRRTFLQWPDPGAVWREAYGAIRSFFVKALPVFVVICVVAAMLDYYGLVGKLGTVLGPIMGVFNLPAKAAIPVVLASIRKDGIALFTADQLSGTVGALDPLQVLVAVYLAGLLLPCLVTAFTIAREVSLRYALKLMARQAIAVVGFSLVIAWGGELL